MPKKKEELITCYAKQAFNYSEGTDKGPRHIAVEVGDKLTPNEVTYHHWAKRDLVQDEPVKVTAKKAAAKE